MFLDHLHGCAVGVYDSFLDALFGADGGAGVGVCYYLFFNHIGLLPHQSPHAVLEQVEEDHCG